MANLESARRARWLAVLGASPQDRWRTLGLFAFFFAVIATFWIQKPLRTARFLSEIGPTQLPWVKLGTAALVLPVALLYSAAAARYRRERMVYACVGIFAACTLGFWWLLSSPAPPTWSTWAYFFYVDIFNSVMVALFWSFANDVTSPEAARRSYGFIGAGGIIGGAVGSAITGAAVKTLGPANLLLGCLGGLAAIAVIAYGLAHTAAPPDATDDARTQTPTLRDAVAGARLTLASPYLAAVALLVALYEIVSNIIDFQFNTQVAARYTNDAAMASFLGYFSSVAISASVIAQLLVTTWVLRGWGPRVALLILPTVLALGSGAFIVVPIFAVIAGCFFSDAALSYSLNQTAKEVLYTPTDAATKYQAKAFIDMFLMRLAKGVGSLLILGWIAWMAPRGWHVQHLGWLSLTVIAAWCVVARAAGRGFTERTKPTAEGQKRQTSTDRLLPSSWSKRQERYGEA
jgi:AAA family ATP:ADP antiporter